MRFLKFSILILIPLLFLTGNQPSANTSCRTVVARVLKSINNIKTQQCIVKSIENNDGSLSLAESFVKLNISPKKIYYKNEEKGTELIWVKGENGGDAIVHSRAIPFMNFNLDPYGSLMRRENHHTIFDLGFKYIGHIVANAVVSSSAPGEFDKHFSLGDSLTWNDIDCHQVVIDFPEYKYIAYTVSKGETASSIAMKFSTSDYKIREKNDLSSYYGSIKAGKKLLIPTPYGSKVVLYVDKQRYIPICVKIYDENGLFESYEFYDVKINIPFAEDEFSEDNEDYSF